MTHPIRVHICVVIILKLLTNEGQTALLTTDPKEITIGGQSSTPTLTITCAPNADDIQGVISLEIGKKISNTENQAMVEIYRGLSNVVTVDPSLSDRMKASGFIQDPSGRIQIVLSQLKASDAGTYVCKTSYIVGGDIKNDEANAVVIATFVTDGPSTTDITAAERSTDKTLAGTSAGDTETETMADTTVAGNNTGATSSTWSKLVFLPLMFLHLV